MQTDSEILAATRVWLERAVIGLNLCPFARKVYIKQQIRYAICHATQEAPLLHALENELTQLIEHDPAELDTTLLIVPDMLADFHDYNDFLWLADQTLTHLGYSGILQIASFHPRYQFAGSAADDIENYTNRAPYPMLHLLREASISRAVEAFPEADAIYERNIAHLRQLGHAGWVAHMHPPETPALFPLDPASDAATGPIPPPSKLD